MAVREPLYGLRRNGRDDCDDKRKVNVAKIAKLKAAELKEWYLASGVEEKTPQQGYLPTTRNQQQS